LDTGALLDRKISDRLAKAKQPHGGDSPHGDRAGTWSEDRHGDRSAGHDREPSHRRKENSTGQSMFGSDSDDEEGGVVSATGGGARVRSGGHTRQPLSPVVAPGALSSDAGNRKSDVAAQNTCSKHNVQEDTEGSELDSTGQGQKKKYTVQRKGGSVRRMNRAVNARDAESGSQPGLRSGGSVQGGTEISERDDVYEDRAVTRVDSDSDNDLDMSRQGQKPPVYRPQTRTARRPKSSHNAEGRYPTTSHNSRSQSPPTIEEQLRNAKRNAGNLPLHASSAQERIEAGARVRRNIT
jgi:hypothetical protein